MKGTISDIGMFSQSRTPMKSGWALAMASSGTTVTEREASNTWTTGAP